MAGRVTAPMAVSVKFMGDLPAVTGQRSIVVALRDGDTVAELLASLSHIYGDAFASRVFSGPTKLHHTMLIFVDGENIKDRHGLATRLDESVVEVIMLPMFGGG